VSLRHYPIFNGAPMAQKIRAIITWCPKGKTNGAMARHFVFSNGAPMAQWRRIAEVIS
jgi:hypothetical protein